MNQDIQQIADQDPIMAQLFELKATFLYKDWQLFRARDAKGSSPPYSVSIENSLLGSRNLKRSIFHYLRF